MSTKPTIPKRTADEQALYEKQVIAKFTRIAALALAFLSVYYFFIKLVFL